MDKEKWKRVIVKACKQAGTYETFFGSVIDTLSQIMETRDRAHDQYIQSGAHPTIVHTNKAKEKNVVKNPILVMENELNAQALAYWRDLGLTPSGYKKLDGKMDKDTGGALEKIIASLSEE